MKTSFKAITILLLGLFLLSPVYANSQKPASIYDNAILWITKTNGAVYSSPLIYNDILYIGSHDKFFYAFHSQTGEEIWKYKTDNAIRSTAACTEEIICVESGNELYGFNFDGTLLWKTPLNNKILHNQFDAWDYFHSSPVIENGVAYICTENGKALGVDITNGEIVFSFQVGKKTNGIRVNPVFHENKLYFGDWNGLFSAVDIPNDSLLWAYDVTPERIWNGGLPAIQTHPIIFNDAVYFSGRGSVFYALDIKTGEKKWTYESPTNEWLVGGITLSDNIIYFGSSNQRMVHAMDPISGELLWRTNVEDGRIFGKPCVDENYVFAGTGYDDPNFGSLVILNKETGELLNRFEVDNQIQSSPVLSNEILYFGCVNGNIYAIKKETLVQIPRPILHINSESLNINHIGSTEANFDTTFTIYNTGSGADSVSIDWSSYFPINKEAITIIPSEFSFAPHDSQKVSIVIDATKLNIGTSYVFFNVYSHYALRNNFQRKSSQIEVVEATHIDNNTKAYEFSLMQNYPNPFNPTTEIKYSVHQKTHVDLNVYNINGEKIKTLVSDVKSPGEYQVSMDGSKLAGGVYFYQFTAGNQILTRKMMLIK